MESPDRSEDLLLLYRRAFADHGTQALWNMRRLEIPTPEDGLAVARALRVEGDMQARVLAEEMERVCRAAV
jgi:hypothetical protein